MMAEQEQTVRYTMPDRLIKSLIKKAIDLHGMAQMDAKKFLSAVGYPENSKPLKDKLTDIQDFLRDRMASSEWLIVLSTDVSGMNVIWHIISDMNPAYNRLMQKGTLHGCLGPRCDL